MRAKGKKKNNKEWFNFNTAKGKKNPQMGKKSRG